MSSTPKFAHCDTSKPDGCYVQFERKIMPDHDARPEEKLFNDDDPEAMAADQARLDAWKRDEWHFIGIRAVAKCFIVSGGVGTYVNIESPGLWGTESDSDESYINEIYGEEIATLKTIIAAFKKPQYE